MTDIIREFREKFKIIDGYLVNDSRKVKLIEKFLLKAIQEARQSGIKEEEQRWINQPANKHDNRIRQEAIAQTEKAFGGCKKCYGKGYATVKYGYSESDGFIKGSMKTRMEFCSCNRGQQLLALLEKKGNL